MRHPFVLGPKPAKGPMACSTHGWRAHILPQRALQKDLPQVGLLSRLSREICLAVRKCRVITKTQKGTVILTTNHIGLLQSWAFLLGWYQLGLECHLEVHWTYLDLQNRQNDGPYAAYSFYFGILGAIILGSSGGPGRNPL